MERWEAAYDAEAGFPRALKGLSKMLNQVTTLRRENTELIARVRELEVRMPASTQQPVPFVRKRRAVVALSKRRLFMCLDSGSTGEAGGT
jgi:hypothetical protein